MVKLDITLILFASELADVVARARLGAHRPEDIVLIPRKHVLRVIRYDDVAAQRVDVMVFVASRLIVRQTRYLGVA